MNYVYTKFHRITILPMVVMTVPAKNNDCPKLQLGSDIVTFRVADTPRFVAITTAAINFSKAPSKKE